MYQTGNGIGWPRFLNRGAGGQRGAEGDWISVAICMTLRSPQDLLRQRRTGSRTGATPLVQTVQDGSTFLRGWPRFLNRGAGGQRGAEGDWISVAICMTLRSPQDLLRQRRTGSRTGATTLPRFHRIPLNVRHHRGKMIVVANRAIEVVFLPELAVVSEKLDGVDQRGDDGEGSGGISGVHDAEPSLWRRDLAEPAGAAAGSAAHATRRGSARSHPAEKLAASPFRLPFRLYLFGAVVSIRKPDRS